MKTLFCFLIVVTLCFSQETTENRNDLAQFRERIRDVRDFNQLFAKKREIMLEVGQQPIGEISRLDMSPEQNLLVLDRIGKELFLFTRTGQLIRKVNVENDEPGLKWNPQIAKFGANGSIIVRVDGSHNLFLFDKNGLFQRKIPAIFPFQYLDFVMDVTGSIYGYSLMPPDEFYVKKLNPAGEVIIKGGVFPKKYQNWFGRMTGEGNLLILDKMQNIYQVNECGPEIYKLSSDLTLLDTFDRIPAYYRVMDSDIPDLASNPMTALKQATRQLNSCTHTHSVYLFNDNLILLQYIDFGTQNGWYLDFCSLGGEYVSDQKIASATPIIAVHHTFVYKVYQSEQMLDGEIPNPVIIEYELIVKK